jgi:hypothetical protein
MGDATGGAEMPRANRSPTSFVVGKRRYVDGFVVKNHIDEGATRRWFGEVLS